VGALSSLHPTQACIVHEQVKFNNANGTNPINLCVWSHLDPSAAEFRRRSQPAPCSAAAAGKKLGAPPRQPKFTDAAAAQVILTHCDTYSSFIMKLSNSLFGS